MSEQSLEMATSEQSLINSTKTWSIHSTKKGRTRGFWGFALMLLLIIVLLIVFLKSSTSYDTKMYAHLLTTPNVYCNDGSTPGFYYSPSPSNSKTWVVFLPGGFFCYSNQSCFDRRADERLGDLMTGPSEGTVEEGEGLISGSADENPYLFDANRVMLQYCSSDAYFGNQSYDKSEGLYTDELHFHGGPMVRALLTELVRDYGMDKAATVYVAGESVGGIALLGRFDELVEQLQTEISPEVQVVGISSAGWYLLNRSYDDFPEACTIVLSELLAFVKASAFLDSDCSASMDPLYCFFGEFVMPFIQSSPQLYVVQNMFDKSHAAAEGFFDLDTLPAEEIVDPFPFEDAKLYHQQIPPPSAAYFVPDCRCHNLIATPDWNRAQIDGNFLPDSVDAFFRHLFEDPSSDTSTFELLDPDPNCLECNPSCAELDCSEI